MPNRMIWINTANIDRFDNEPNKSGLLNDLLEEYYGTPRKPAISIGKGITSPKKVVRENKAGNTPPAAPTEGKQPPAKDSKDILCAHFQAKGECLQKGCKFNRGT